MQNLDEYDKQLLRLLQQNNMATAGELGKLVNLSSSAVQRRIARLREEKIIQADVSIVSPAAAGIGVTCVVDVILEVGNTKAVEKFKKSIENCTEITQCYYVTGTYDFVLMVNTGTMEQYERFSTLHLMDNPNVKHFYTHVIMEKIKVSYGVNI